MAPAMLRHALTVVAIVKAWFANALREATKATRNLLLATWRAASHAYQAFVTAVLSGYRYGMAKFGPDTLGSVSFAAIISGVLALIVGIVGAVVAVSVLASLFPTYVSSIGDIVAVLNSNAAENKTGDATADSLRGIFGTLIAFAGLFGIVGAAVAVVVIKVRGMGKGA